MNTPRTDEDRRAEAQQLCELACNKVDLLTFVQTAFGTQGRRFGKSVGFNRCPNPDCGESHSNSVKVQVFADNHWHCFACAKGGTVVNFATYLWSKQYPVLAARELLGNNTFLQMAPCARVSDAVIDAAEVARLEALEKVFTIIHKFGFSTDPKGTQYLEERGIPSHIQMEAFRRGLLRFLPSNPHEATRWLRERVGEGLLKQAGLWKEGKRFPSIAYRPLVFLLPSLKGAEFRIIKEAGENDTKAITYGVKDVPWFWGGSLDASADRVAVVEGAIDLLSLVSLGCRCSVLGLPGASSWRRRFKEWFGDVRAKRNAGFILLLDPDKAGVENTEKLLEAMKEEKMPAVAKPVPGGGDINDYLRSVKQAGKP